MSQGQMMKICKIFPLYTFQMSSCMDVRWNLKSHLVCNSCENFGVVGLTLGHVRWMRGEIWKVISCAPHVRTLVWWRGHLVTLDRCEVRFEKSSCVHLVWEIWGGGGDSWLCKMDMMWDLKSHLACTSCENFDVVEGTLGHARWTSGEIWKVISHATHVRTLVWWSWHLVMLDGHKVKFEKSSCMHLGGAHTWSC